ncbi:DDE-type integrase/transposase/recombinase [Mesorhizobium sp. M0587]
MPNLARGMELTGINQLWVADITYLHLAEQFAYLAVALDALSRKVIGWTLELRRASLAVDALKMAISARDPVPGSLIHHSDRGAQYACASYSDILHGHGIHPSLSHVGNPYDNARAESFMKTLKQEEVAGVAIAMHQMRGDVSRASLKMSTIGNGCIQHSTISPLKNKKRPYTIGKCRI